MTADDFTTAARAEAERVFITSDPNYPDRDAAWVRVGGFQEGALWAREYLITQDPTPEEIEAVARTLNHSGSTCNGGYDEPGRYDECEDRRRTTQGLARATLVAARGGNR